MATCDLCQDPTCPCGAVMLGTDAQLIDALRACLDTIEIPDSGGDW
jgi:hypothetical protein